MTSLSATPQGLWLPLITPFRDGAVDEISVRRLLQHYARQPIDGLILAATTGEGLTLDAAETERLVAVSAETLCATGCRLPIYLGLCGSDTRHLLRRLAQTASWPADGYLIACPYYSRPSQDGLTRHFLTLAEAAAKPILIYNIPYRTGVNLGNEAMLMLAQHQSIVGVKDCCADAAQSFDLISRRPDGFAVLTGEDAFYAAALLHGADGGILASAHIRTAAFAAIPGLLRDGERQAARAAWQPLAELTRLLFTEPNPAPIKHWLWRSGLIDSPEQRLPMTPVSQGLAARIDRAMLALHLAA